MGRLFPCTPSSYQQADHAVNQARTEAGIIVDHGAASFIDNHQIQITDAGGKQKTLTAENFIIATGSRPFILGSLPPPLGENHQSTLDHDILNRDQLLEHERIPTHILIVGAGYIGVEFASIYRALGSKPRLSKKRSVSYQRDHWPDKKSPHS